MALKTKYEITAHLEHTDILLKRLSEVVLAKVYFCNHYTQTWDELFKTKRYKRFNAIQDKCNSRIKHIIHKIGEQEFEDYNSTDYNISYFFGGLDTRSKIDIAYEEKDEYYRCNVVVKIVWEEKY